MSERLRATLRTLLAQLSLGVDRNFCGAAHEGQVQVAWVAGAGSHKEGASMPPLEVSVGLLLCHGASKVAPALVHLLPLCCVHLECIKVSLHRVHNAALPP